MTHLFFAGFGEARLPSLRFSFYPCICICMSHWFKLSILSTGSNSYLPVEPYWRRQGDRNMLRVSPGPFWRHVLAWESLPPAVWVLPRLPTHVGFRLTGKLVPLPQRWSISWGGGREIFPASSPSLPLSLCAKQHTYEDQRHTQHTRLLFPFCERRPTTTMCQERMASQDTCSTQTARDFGFPCWRGVIGGRREEEMKQKNNGREEGRRDNR